MQLPYLLLALVASAAADNTAQRRWSAEGESALKSREPIEISPALEARLASIDVSRRGSAISDRRQHKRDFDGQDYDDPFRHVHDMINEDRDHENDDDDDDEDRGGRSNGATIAGGVVGGFAMLLFLLTIWYFIRIRPKRKQRLMQAAKTDEVENGYAPSPSPSTHQLSTLPASSAHGSPSPPEHVRWAPTPYPAHAPSVQTGSSISGLALPTPALTYSPSVTTAATPPLPPSPPHVANEKPPTYAAVIALQSSEPQPEATAYQMGQTPAPIEPPVYHLPAVPQPGATDLKGEPISRY